MEVKEDIRRSDMRRHILDTAKNLMVVNGINETSLKDIAVAAGISTGTLYYYFAARDDIIFEIAKENMQQISDEIFEEIKNINSDVNREEVIKSLFDKILSVESRSKLHLYLISNAVSSGGALAEKFKKQYVQWRSMLKNGLDRFAPSEDNTVLAYAVQTMLDGCLIQMMFSTESVPVNDMLDIIMK